MAFNFYAAVWPDGFSNVFSADWKQVKNKVTGAKYKGFNDKSAAHQWIAETKAPKGSQSNVLNRGEWMARNVNTPYWQKRKKVMQGRMIT